MNLNFRRSNQEAPPITGRISAPEDPEAEYTFAAFHQIDDSGNPYWIGPVETNRSMRQALVAQPQRGTNFVAIRENGFKVFPELFDEDGTPQPNPAYEALSPEQRSKEDGKPAYWATWTRTPAQPQIRASAWEREPNRYGPWASGNTQYPITKEQAAALARGDAPVEMLNEPEPTPAPRKQGRQAAGRAE